MSNYWLKRIELDCIWDFDLIPGSTGHKYCNLIDLINKMGSEANATSLVMSPQLTKKLAITAAAFNKMIFLPVMIDATDCVELINHASVISTIEILNVSL